MSARELLTSAGLHESHWGRRIIAAEDGGFTGRELVTREAPPFVGEMWWRTPRKMVL
jgi:hypothetical protein